MKTILVHIDPHHPHKELTNAVASLAIKFQSRVIGFYPIPKPVISAGIMPETSMAIDGSTKKLHEQMATEIQKEFEAVMRANGLNFEWRQFNAKTENISKLVAENGREADLVILGYGSPDKKVSNADIRHIAEIVLSAGRPVLVLPPQTDINFTINKIAVGWNGSQEASRATFDGLSFLKIADDVKLLQVNPHKDRKKSEAMSCVNLVETLTSHGVRVTSEEIIVGRDAGQSILEYAKTNQVDLLILGAYGRSRISERLTGGTTEFILHHLDRPILLSK